ncbi:MAG: IS4 family transposase [bacterium]
MNAWVSEELSTVNLSDERLDRRAHKILDRVGSKPGISFPAACKGWDETNGAYRFFNNKKVTEQKILSAHKDATLKRMADHKVVLCLQDTTEMDFTGRKLNGAGPLSIEERIGFFNHVTLAVTPERICLGTLDAHMWARDFDDLNKSGKRKQKPIEEKESYRWLEGYRKISELSNRFPDTTLISISDREGDIYECFMETMLADESGRAEYIIRGCQDRSLPEKMADGRYKKLMQEVSGYPILGQVEFNLPKSENRSSRLVVQSVQAGRIRLKPPYRKGAKLPEVEINAVLVKEIAPTDGEEPVEWLLLTSLTVETFEQACLVAQYYLCRWQIEIYFKILKSGCKIEERQFETAERIKPCIALYMIVAWRVLFVTMIGRECPDLSCEVLFEDVEWKSVYIIVKNEIPPEDPPPLGDVIIMIAGLGGYLNRKCDGPPGPKTMWVGLQRMVDFALAWKSFDPMYLRKQKDVYKH